MENNKIFLEKLTLLDQDNTSLSSIFLDLDWKSVGNMPIVVLNPDNIVDTNISNWLLAQLYSINTKLTTILTDNQQTTINVPINWQNFPITVKNDVASLIKEAQKYFNSANNNYNNFQIWMYLLAYTQKLVNTISTHNIIMPIDYIIIDNNSIYLFSPKNNKKIIIVYKKKTSDGTSYITINQNIVDNLKIKQPAIWQFIETNIVNKLTKEFSITTYKIIYPSVVADKYKGSVLEDIIHALKKDKIPKIIKSKIVMWDKTYRNKVITIDKIQNLKLYRVSYFIRNNPNTKLDKHSLDQKQANVEIINLLSKYLDN